MKAVCVFCGANRGVRAAYATVAEEFGRALARRGIALVYGGGNVGLMGQLANGALSAGGRVIGVIPEALVKLELAHPGATEMHTVRTMHERKALMADLSDAFVALPGGFGTLDELCEVLTWAQLGFHAKPIGLLDVEGYFAPLRELFDHAVREGFVHAEQRAMLVEESDPEAMLAALERARTDERTPPSKWIERR